MQYINESQLRKLHVLLNQLELIRIKREIILGCTNGRTNSSKELLYTEAKELIGKLSQYDPREGHIKAIKRLAFEAGIIHGDGPADWQINNYVLNKFLIEKGAVKKHLNRMSFKELKEVHKQFEAIVTNNRKANDNKIAKEKTKELLTELGITVK